MSEQQQQAATPAPNGAAAAAQAANALLSTPATPPATPGSPAVPPAAVTPATAPPTAGAPAAPPAAPPAATYYPKDIPETWKGKTDQETIDNLAKHIGQMPKAPEKASDYKLELSPEMSKVFGDLSKDPAMLVFRDVAKKHGLSQQAFEGVFKDFYGQLVEQGVWRPQTETEFHKVFEELGGDIKDPVQRRAEGARRLQSAQTSVDGLVTRNVITKTEADLMKALTVETDGVVLVEKLFGASFRTAVVGVIGGLALAIPQIYALVDGKPETVFSWELFTAGLTAMGFGWFARDNKVTSEQAQDKP